MDKKIIEARLRKFDSTISRLKKMQRIPEKEYQQNQDYQDITERNFQVAIQICIDIANYIIAGANLTVPDDASNIFVTLGKSNIIEKQLVEKIKNMVGFPNILVHDYLEIEPQQVYDMLQHELSDFDDFAKAIVRYIDSK